MLPKSSFLKRHLHVVVTAAAFVFLGGAIYIFFFLDWVKYPSYLEKTEYCYSPNHEYYITLWQSAWSAKTDQLYAKGTAKLYDKTGKLLYSGKTFLSNEFGPLWADNPYGKSSVVFVESSVNWSFELPTSPGRAPKSPSNRGCF